MSDNTTLSGEEQQGGGSEQKTWCPECETKGVVQAGVFRAKCPECGNSFDPREHTPENYEEPA